MSPFFGVDADRASFRAGGRRRNPTDRTDSTRGVPAWLVSARRRASPPLADASRLVMGLREGEPPCEPVCGGAPTERRPPGYVVVRARFVSSRFPRVLRHCIGCRYASSSDIILGTWRTPRRPKATEHTAHNLTRNGQKQGHGVTAWADKDLRVSPRLGQKFDVTQT